MAGEGRRPREPVEVDEPPGVTIRRMGREHDGPHVSHLFEKIEVVNALRHRALREDLTAMSISRYAQTAILPRIWGLRANFSAYAAAHIALAETLEAPLVTGDAGLARALEIRTEVEVYG